MLSGTTTLAEDPVIEVGPLWITHVFSAHPTDDQMNTFEQFFGHVPQTIPEQFLQCFRVHYLAVRGYRQ